MRGGPGPTDAGAREWRNWSGSVRCTPTEIHAPSSEDELCAVIRRAAACGRHVRAVGAGHSSSALVSCPDVQLSISRLTGIVAVDRDAGLARVRPGTVLSELGRTLYRHDLALPNYGDIADQTIAGAIATGTHGTGLGQPCLSRWLAGARLVDARGTVHRIDGGDSDLLRASRLSLGVLGVFSELTLELVPAFDAERREYHARTDEAIEGFQNLAREHRSFDLYWYPRRDDVKLRVVNPPGGGGPMPASARLLEWRDGAGHEVIPAHSGLPHCFEECEYAFTLDAGLRCFAEVRRRILQRWRHVLGWRVLLRTLAGDDALLSPTRGREAITVSIHQNASLPWRALFRDIEDIFDAHDGLPHWAKKHRMRAVDLAARHPHWDAFRRIRRRLDPEDRWLSPRLRPLLEHEA